MRLHKSILKQTTLLLQQKRKNHAQLAVAEFGEDCGKPPLVILHGLLGSKRNWQAICKQLARTDRQILAVDVRNHGDSPHVPEMTYKAMANDVGWLLEERCIEQIDLLGHSMGGKISMYYALTEPARIRKLIIEDVSPCLSKEAVTSFPGYLAAMKAVKFDQTAPNLGQLRKEVEPQLMEAFPDKALRSFIVTNITQHHGVYGWKVNLDAIIEHLQEIAEWPKMDATFTKPTLFVGGEKSNRITEEGHAERERLFPGAKEEIIANAGHWVHADQPREFIRVVTDFLDS